MRCSDRPNVKKSYKNTCGTPAPKGTLHCPATIPKKSAAVKKMSMAVVGRTLHWTKIGERQTVRAVSHLSSFPHFAKGCSSGAVAVEMEGLLFCALNAKSFHFVLGV